MFHRRDECPIEAANEIHYCAAQGIDHRKVSSLNNINLYRNFPETSVFVFGPL